MILLIFYKMRLSW